MTRQQFIKHLIRCGKIKYDFENTGNKILEKKVTISSEYIMDNMTAIDIQPPIPYSMLQDEVDKVLDIISTSIDANIENETLSLIFDIRNTDPNGYEPYRIYNKMTASYIKDQNGETESFIDEDDAYDYLIKDIYFNSLWRKYRYEVDINTKVRRLHDDYIIDITEETKQIFGNDVKKVEVTFLYVYDDLSEYELHDNVIKDACNVLTDLFLNPSYVQFGDETLYITFHSGNQIKITNSEWADISKA